MQRGTKNVSGGFTLAEVLITLGIIGVVVAMTLPVLTQGYRKNVLETRIKKFVSVYRQAVIMAEAEHGPKEYWDVLGEQDSQVIGTTGEAYLAYFNKYLGKYIKTTSHIVLQDGVAFALADGSGFIFYYDLKFCVEYKKCMELIDKAGANGSFAAKNGKFTDGKNVFLFGKFGNSYAWKWDGTESKLITGEYGCRSGNDYPLWCSKLLEYNGWNVPKDYPIKL